jgi:hypothetical protein
MGRGARLGFVSIFLFACSTTTDLSGSRQAPSNAPETGTEIGTEADTDLENANATSASSSTSLRLALPQAVGATFLSERLELSDSAEYLALLGARHVDVFAADGRHSCRIPSTGHERRHRFWGSRLLVPKVTGLDSHVRRVSAFDVYSVAGEHLAQIPAANARFTRPAGDFLMVIGPHAITRWDDEGRQVWAVPGSAHELASAEQADAQLWVDESDTRRLIHLRQGETSTTFSCRSPIWNVAIDSVGRYSAATTQWRLHRFEYGRWLSSLDVPAPYLTSVAVSVRGDVLVGTTDFEQLGQVFWFDTEGQLRSVWQFGSDASSLRPRVRFVENKAAGAFRVEHGRALYEGVLGEPSLQPFIPSPGLRLSLHEARGEKP